VYLLLSDEQLAKEGELMNVRNLALVGCLAASCGGCVTETKTMPLTGEMANNIKGLKETEYPKREAQPQTWVAVGDLYQTKACDPATTPAQQSACFDEARKSYQKALEIDPKFVPAHLQLAKLYVNKDDPDRAVGVYKRAIEQNPKLALLWYEQGMVQCSRKDLNSAVQCLAKAHELEPDNGHYATQYGLCLARMGKPQEATMALATVMNKAEANYNVARMMAHINQPELSRQYLQVALMERPNHQGALTLMAQLNDPRQSTATAAAGQATLQFDPRIERASYAPNR
jgi:tetratricopeptide (TPR) repeat protein